MATTSDSAVDPGAVTDVNELPVSVLIVDDRLENRKALRAVLERPGYRIVEAASSADALKALLGEDFAVLLLDVVMPDMNGFELAELVHARARTRTTPILFVTGQAGQVDLIARGYRVGAVDYLIKPLVPEIVRAKVSVFAQLYRQRLLLEAALREKEVLLREIHHRVKNNLQIISSLLHLQAAHATPDVKAQFIESIMRVRSIALVHERLHLSENLAAIDVEAYLRSLTSRLAQTYDSRHARLEVRAMPIPFSIDAAIPCGLIVNELVSNSLKYAFPEDREGVIKVSLREESSGDITLEVTDDGIGLPTEIDISKTKSMGLQLVRSLTSQLGGQLEIQRNHGTCISIRFPKPRPG